MKRFITPWRLAIVALFAFIYWYSLTPQTLQYRLTVEIQNDQKIITKSSIRKSSYYHEDYGLLKGWSQIPWRSDCSGVAILFDLDNKGWLIVPLGFSLEGLTLKERERAHPKRPNIPLGCDLVKTSVFGYDASRIWRAQFEGSKIIEPQIYPAFIWVPPHSNWHQARQLLHDELASALPGVSIKSITVKPDFWAQRVTRISDAPKWLQNLRATEPKSEKSGQFNFSQYMIER
jgi:hypothetical protein